MTRLTRNLGLVPVVFGLLLAVGCGSSSSTENKQPSLTGTPDPKVKGPATPGVGGAKPGDLDVGGGPSKPK